MNTEIKQMIIDKVTELEDKATFLDLCTLPDFNGEHHLMNPLLNCIYWLFISESFLVALTELVRDGLLAFEQVDPQVYVEGGCTLVFPVATKLEWLPLPRWLPVVLKVRSNFAPNGKDRRSDTKNVYH